MRSLKRVHLLSPLGGGWPPNSGDLLSTPRSMLEWTTREDFIFSEVNPKDSVSWQLPENGNQEMGDRIIEATGFIVTEDGTVRLVADADTFGSSNINPIRHPNCRQ